MDTRAKKVVVDATRRVALGTGLIPWPLGDVLLVFPTNLQMLRRLAEIYGNRPGVVASWVINRKILVNVVVAGATSEFVKMLGRIFEKGVFSKLTGSITEGVTNGLLTARIGLTAMELCRPLPFRHDDPDDSSTSKPPSLFEIATKAIPSLLNPFKKIFSFNNEQEEAK